MTVRNFAIGAREILSGRVRALLTNRALAT